MIPDLKPDIYRCIAKHLQPEIDLRPPGAEDEIRVNQQTLLNLMLCSKAMYDIVAPELYARCSVGNPSSILTALRTNVGMINKIQHLHLYTGKYSEEPTYTDLLENGLWKSVGLNFTKDTPWMVAQEVDQCYLISSRVKETINKGYHPFPNLRSVSLGGYEGQIWEVTFARKWETDLIKQLTFDHAKGLPHILLGSPSVEHLCQSIDCGPLALSPVVIKPLTPLKVFTYHRVHPGPMCSFITELGPIVVGAINRYYFTHGLLPNCSDQRFAQHGYNGGDEVLLGGLVAAFHVFENVLLMPNSSPAQRIAFDMIDLENTVIELYDIFRSDDDPDSGQKGHIRTGSPSTPLSELQKTLDNELPELWKGKVVLKKKEDAPPCTACGLILADGWWNPKDGEEEAV